MRRKVFLGLIALVVIIGIVLYFYFREQKEEVFLTLYGNVDVRQVDIGFRVAGQVERLHYQEGDLVAAGSLMATLDERPYRSQLEAAEANRESIKANFENAEILLKRRQELISSGGVSTETLNDALANRNALRSNFTSAEASYRVAEDNLYFTKAYAPVEGIVLTRIREPGTVVNPGDPVYTLSVTSPVWIRAFVTEPDLGQIYFGMEAEIHTDTEGAPVYKGRIGFISPVAEFTPKTVQTTSLRTDLVYRLRIYVDQPDTVLKQGMPVTVKLYPLHFKNGDFSCAKALALPKTNS